VQSAKAPRDVDERAGLRARVQEMSFDP